MNRIILKNSALYQPTKLIQQQYSKTLVRSLSSQTDNVKQEQNATITELASQMSWQDYFKLKKKRRIIERVLSVPTTVAAAGGTATYLLNTLEISATPELVYGLDPQIFLILAVAGSGMIGYFMGPLLENVVFRALYNKQYHIIKQKDSDFFKRIAKYRSNVTSQVVNQAPDFYGEKIFSVKDYRTWLRRQYEHKHSRE
ncbi:mitochondrial import protein Pam17 [Conidiobolus coronatus NRRL 28638]|uniref:Presequence translocated-associated motor subunit PAM17 n=1 Tax=Conidiobolus coronatus (strain ATCC 28846 / CBS 209.66 / NRRL 28638) TaxID=796925 RepID=A0A137NQ16_CONC2|nr:mitochondrial import protein Pam17 [Conidiobolus coronatus NRRL 28638]|eukprot:KXN64831.1 mitochondrial import protein Pam17 [Conidiobolus coronatus NRRL 28638]